jgi:hypothetical protein
VKETFEINPEMKKQRKIPCKTKESQKVMKVIRPTIVGYKGENWQRTSLISLFVALGSRGQRRETNRVLVLRE